MRKCEVCGKGGCHGLQGFWVFYHRGKRRARYCYRCSSSFCDDYCQVLWDTSSPKEIVNAALKELKSSTCTDHKDIIGLAADRLIDLGKDQLAKNLLAASQL